MFNCLFIQKMFLHYKERLADATNEKQKCFLQKQFRHYQRLHIIQSN